MSIIWARVDERLIHGQIVHEWIVRVNPKQILIVDDNLAKDRFMSGIYKALVPLDLEVLILTVTNAIKYLKENANKKIPLFVLAKNPEAFKCLAQSGIALPVITLANKVYFSSRAKFELPLKSRHAINWLLAHGIKVVAQKLPNDIPKIISPYPE